MHILKKETAPRYHRLEGITSYLLASPRTSNAEHLTTTLAVIQPGGSVRDEEVIRAADEHGIAMVFTGVRHFRH